MKCQTDMVRFINTDIHRTSAWYFIVFTVDIFHETIKIIMILLPHTLVVSLMEGRILQNMTLVK